MPKDHRIFLKHILESIDWIENDVRDLSEGNFQENIPIQDAVIRRLEIIGEAIRNLPDDFKQTHPEIPWQDIQDMRNKLIHEYFGVDIDLVWAVVKNDLPLLKEQIKSILD